MADTRDKTLECQGMPCPQPVLQCKRCIEDERPQRLRVVVDNDPARENVSRFLGSQGYEVAVERDGGNWVVLGTREAPGGADEDCEACRVMSREELDAVADAPAAAAQGPATVCVFLTTERMGVGDDELGGKLMGNFLATLPELGGELWRLVLVNGGVRLACDGHEHVDKVLALADKGVDVLVCGTCLEFFGLLEAKAVGETTNMLDVVTSLQLADKVIKL